MYRASSTLGGVDEEIPRYLQLLWGIEPAVRRGPRASRTIAEIGDAAVAIADEHGLDAVSMKAVATALGMTTMSLYRYVDAKDELYAVMLDRSYGPPPADIADPPGIRTWRERTERWARGIAARLCAHPWVVHVDLGGPPLSPHAMAWMEAGLAALQPTGLRHQECLSSMLVIDGFLRQHVRQSLAMGVLPSPVADEPAEWPVGQFIDPARFPHLASARPALEDDGDFYAEELAFGLNLVLDGIAALMPAPSPRSADS